MSAVAFLYVSTPAISSGETSPNDRPRELLALKLSRPLNSLRTCGRPRITTPEGSAEKCEVSPDAAKRVTVMPLMRCRASATRLVGERADVGGGDRVDDRVGFFLDFLRSRQCLADAGDEDLGEIVFGLRGRRVRRRCGAAPVRWRTEPATWLRVREWIILSRAIFSRSRLHAATFSMLWTLQCPPCIETESELINSEIDC